MWIFSVFLYLLFIFAPDQYKLEKAAGAQCNTFSQALGDRLGIHEDPTTPPPCFYDPSAN